MPSCYSTPNGEPVRKKGYRSRKGALQGMHRIAGKRNWDTSKMSVYKCQECKRWHFGHNDGSSSNGEHKTRYPGVVKWFDDHLGYGFIVRDGDEEELFVHASSMAKLPVSEGDRVTFAVEKDKKGRGPRASEVYVL